MQFWTTVSIKCTAMKCTAPKFTDETQLCGAYKPADLYQQAAGLLIFQLGNHPSYKHGRYKRQLFYQNRTA